MGHAEGLWNGGNMKPRIKRNSFVRYVAEGIPSKYVNDLPAIREALNVTADSFRRDGYTVPDFAQDAMVRDVRLMMERKM
jgi:hypothetical protein